VVRGIEELNVEMGRLLSKMARPCYPLVEEEEVVVVVVGMVCLCQ
jgi:hypothetical protein